MKRGIDEEIKGPMFPRLHVNDTEKKGPRAPPRNKMALYEQLSIPSQRFNHHNKLATQHQSEKPHGQFCEFAIPFTQGNQRKKLDEDDYRVPIFVQSQQCGKFAHPSSFSRPFNAEKMSCLRQEAKPQNSKTFETSRFKPTSLPTNDNVEGVKKQMVSSLNRESRDSSSRLEVHNTVENDALGENTVVSCSEEPQGVRDIRNESGYQDKSPFRSRNPERVDSVTETCVMDTVTRSNITPDEVVSTIGQKLFWKARKAILNQQRVFAVQVFELHRLVKVQRSIAEAPQILTDDAAFLGEPAKVASPVASNHPPRVITDVPNQEGQPDKPIHVRDKCGVETSGKPSSSSVQNCVPPRPFNFNGTSPAPCLSSSQNTRPWCFTQPPGQQWLFPMMTPEGLVYKPYPMPGFTMPGPMPCGIPAPTPAYQMPYFPPAGPHGYFPSYGHPMVNGAAFSNSSVEQNPPPNLNVHHHDNNVASPDVSKGNPAGELQDSRGRDDTERTGVLPLFPTSPTTDPPRSSPRRESAIRVIKVVPHNAKSATESAARIFQSIQDERKQFD